MDREFQKFYELAEMGPMVMNPSSPDEYENRSLDNKLDTLSSTIHDIRNACRKCMDAESPEDKQLYKDILYKYMCLFNRLWKEACKEIGEKISDNQEKREVSVVFQP